MNKIVLGVLAAVFCFGLLIVVVLFSQGAGMYNTFVAQETGLQAQYKQNQNVYDNFLKKVKEVAQVPEMYSDDLLKVYDAAMKDRYGKDGSKAVWQFIQEHNPTVDASIYKEVQQVIESGRNEFSANQEMLLDKKKTYVATLRSFPNNIYAGFLGFPKVDLDKIDIVTSARTEKAFETKQDEAIDLSRNKK